MKKFIPLSFYSAFRSSGIGNLNLRTNHPEGILFTSVLLFLVSARSLGGLELTAVSTDKLFIVAIMSHQHSVISNEALTSLIQLHVGIKSDRRK